MIDAKDRSAAGFARYAVGIMTAGFLLFVSAEASGAGSFFAVPADTNPLPSVLSHFDRKPPVVFPAPQSGILMPASRTPSVLLHSRLKHELALLQAIARSA